MAERQVRIEEQMKSVATSLEAIRGTMALQAGEASESRRRLYEAQEKMRADLQEMRHRLDGLDKTMNDIRPTTTELERVRDRVIFAGRAGAVLWSVGKALISAAAGAAAAWYALTGRPPP